MARSSKLTGELMKNFVAAQSMGLSIKSSCDYCGITERVYYKWMEQAREDVDKGRNTKFVQFLHEVKRANANFRAYHMMKIKEAGEAGSWQASAWLLERCCPDEYGRSIKVGTDNGILGDLLSAMKSEEDKR